MQTLPGASASRGWSCSGTGGRAEPGALRSPGSPGSPCSKTKPEASSLYLGSEFTSLSYCSPCHRQVRLAMASTGCPGKEGMGGRKRNLALLKNKLYIGERRRTEPVVENTVGAGDHSTLRRSQSDRTEYSQKLQGTGEACSVLCY